MANGIEGLDGLMKKFGSLAEAAAARNMEKAVGASVKTVQASAKLLCPVNDGELRGSIRTRVEEKEGRSGSSIRTKSTPNTWNSARGRKARPAMKGYPRK